MLLGQRQPPCRKDVKARALLQARTMRGAPIVFVLLLLLSAVSASHWAGYEEIDNGVGHASGADVAIASDGSAIAVWRQNPGDHKVYANLYIPGHGWQGAHRISTGTEDVCSPTIARTPGGQAFVAWGQGPSCGNSGTNRNAYAAIYTPGQAWPNGWSTPVTLESKSEPVMGNLHMAAAAGGHAVVAWAHDEGGRQSIWAARHVPGTGWTAARELTPASREAFPADAAINTQGHSLVIWGAHQTDPLEYTIAAARYTGSWSQPQILDRSDGALTGPLVALDDAGKGTAAWTGVQLIGGSNVRTIMAARLDGSWSTAARINSGSHGAILEGLDNGDDGSVVALWRGATASGEAVYSARYANGWSAAVQVASVASPEIVQGMSLDVDAYGNAVAVWLRGDSSRPPAIDPSIWAARANPGSPWTAPEALATIGSRSMTPPVVAAAGERATVVWGHVHVTTYAQNVYANTMDADDPLPTVTITKPDSLTKTKQVVVSGTATRGAHLTVQGQGVAVDPATGAFSVTFQRADGQHTFNVQATTAGGTATATASTTVDTTPPSLTITEPSNGSTVDRSTVTFRGLAEAQATVKVNGQSVSVTSSGSFAKTVSLQEGSNSIVVSATDAAGWTTTQTFSITYRVPGSDPPPPGPDEPDDPPATDPPAENQTSPPADPPADPVVDPPADPPSDGSQGQTGTDPPVDPVDPVTNNDGPEPPEDKDSPAPGLAILLALVAVAVRRR